MAFYSPKYQRWHDAIIERARNRVLDKYYETHHIQPRSMGGSNDRDNLVDLTYREHFLVHWILTKIVSGPDRFKMAMALNCMVMNLCSNRTLTGWRIEAAKRAVSDASGERRLERERAERIEARRLLETRLARAARLKEDKEKIAEWFLASKGALKAIHRNDAGQITKKVRKRRRRPRHGRAIRNRIRQEETLTV